MTVLASSVVLVAGAPSAGADQIRDTPVSRMCLIYNIGNFNNLACEKVLTAPSPGSGNAASTTDTPALPTVSSYTIRNNTTDLTLVHVQESGTLLPAGTDHRIEPGTLLTRQAEDNATATTDATVEYSLHTVTGTDLGHLTITMDNGRITSCTTTAPTTGCTFDTNTTTITHQTPQGQG
ncbi:hypothetical protein [Streptomyces sp. NBC_01264]|uniref:hypothetical protein n=1 Tax=Streptomyces sp. NBC_01264 TaxID=2903804 RepID=UPI00224FF7E8|nr:hypothetical protein [Streptomyces sp. NBC_01264]MCX4784535.1 hypothetical protein [Streptomyces sp. NBC_01264]